MSQKEDNLQDSTLAALLREKPKRGRPRHSVSRQNVYVALTAVQKERIKTIAALMPDAIVRADIPDLAITILTSRLEALQRALADRNRIIPEGVTDFESMYLLWDLPLPHHEEEPKWTSIRVSPQQVLELGQAQGILNAAFGATRSQTFSLALTLLQQHLEDYELPPGVDSVAAIRQQLIRDYL